MVLELCASRIVAPYLGSTIIVWTSIIGVILGSLSIGYWAGGRLSDKNSNQILLSYILLFASISILLISLSHNKILTYMNLLTDIRIKSFIASCILFSIPSILLGMISPYAIKLRLKNIERTGQIAGNLYAIATFGSIVGTFLGGFVLIPTLGSNKILFFLSLSLFILALINHPLFWRNIFFKLGLLSIVVLLLFPAQHTLFVLDTDTMYNRVLIHDKISQFDGKPIRVLNLNGWSNTSFSSAIYLDGSKKLIAPYLNYFDLFSHFNPEASSILMIGGGAFAYAQHFIEKYPAKSISVVEIDPELQNIAKKYFGLRESKKLKIYSEDGRVFLNNSKDKYDVVMLDVTYHSSIPFQLATKEALQKIFEKLNDKGVLIVNIIDSLGGKNKFFRAEYWTYKSVFDGIYLFPVSSLANKQVRQNLILIATKKGFQKNNKDSSIQVNSMLFRLSHQAVKNDMPILTDDYAPVEYYALHQ